MHGREANLAHQIGRWVIPFGAWYERRGHRLWHAYDRLGLPVIWHAIQNELPGLEADVRQALRQWNP